MDNGEEIQGLGDGWTFLGANALEWCAGVAMFLIVGEVFFKGKMNLGIPFMMIAAVTTTLSLVRLRKAFPDEEKGVVNHFCVKCGFSPPGVPTPSEFRQHWSGVPHGRLGKNSEFVKLGLNEVFFPEEEDLEASELEQK
jgi:hypothetical protein